MWYDKFTPDIWMKNEPIAFYATSFSENVVEFRTSNAVVKYSIDN